MAGPVHAEAEEAYGAIAKASRGLPATSISTRSRGGGHHQPDTAGLGELFCHGTLEPMLSSRETLGGAEGQASLDALPESSGRRLGTVEYAGLARHAAAGNMSTVRAAHTATLLADGKVLIAGGGGSGGFGFPSFDPAIATAEVYDPAATSFAATGAMGVARFAHTATRATLLLNGKVLVAGGIISLGYLPFSQDASICTGSPDTLVTSTAELYDPATGIFTPTGDMTATREEHTATRLPDGKVLILGGATASLGVLNTAELYDPATGSFTVTANMGLPRSAHTATLLPDGAVLFAGGNFAGGRVDTTCEYGLGSAEIYKELP